MGISGQEHYRLDTLPNLMLHIPALFHSFILNAAHLKAVAGKILYFL